MRSGNSESICLFRQVGKFFDGTATCSDKMKELTLTSFRRLWGRVMTTDGVPAELQESAFS